jgi:SAM-dependent methyltransferase
MSVIWHDLECGGYVEDMALWRSLASARGDPVLDVGAGTGRIALDLAGRGHQVTALDSDRTLLDELMIRAGTLEHIDTIVADARRFELPRKYALCIVPMQTIQLLGGAPGRSDFLRCAGRHLLAGGLLAIALAEMLELYEVVDGSLAPLPDICERDGVLYSSQPTAIRVDHESFVLERRREIVTPEGERSMVHDLTRLDRLTPSQLEREAEAVGLTPAGRAEVPATADYTGSTVVMLRG